MNTVLLLNADHTPLNVITLERAFNLILDGKVNTVEVYEDRVLRSAYKTWDYPAVVSLKIYVRPKKQIRLSRRNVLARDGFTCQYCHAQPVRKSGMPDFEVLTVDHVVPRAKAKDGWVQLPWKGGARVRVSSWENETTACSPCNSRKADLDLTKSGMRFISGPPKAPSSSDIIRMAIVQHKTPQEWAMYLPEEMANA